MRTNFFYVLAASVNAVVRSIPSLALPSWNAERVEKLPFILRIRGGSTRAMSKDDDVGIRGNDLIGDKETWATQSNYDSSDSPPSVTKNGGKMEPLDKNKVSGRFGHYSIVCNKFSPIVHSTR